MRLLPASLYCKNNFLVLFKGNNCCTINDISAQYKRVQDLQLGQMVFTIPEAKLTERMLELDDC